MLFKPKRPDRPKIGLSDEVFMRLWIVGIVLAVLFCLGVISGFFDAAPSEYPPDSAIEHSAPVPMAR